MYNRKELTSAGFQNNFEQMRCSNSTHRLEIQLKLESQHSEGNTGISEL